MVQDLVHNLCESLVENIDGVSGATSRKVVVATPVITLTDNSVTITCDTTGAIIYYTLDGSTPTSSSTQYSAAFTLDSSCTIKAIAIKGGKSSGIAEEEYVKPITYLTQWQMMGNSVVHTDEYLTQWKVEGNSVVDNNAILSCGDYSDVDGKYHVKISNGVTIYDIPLTEPLRKVNDVADSIEFANGVATLTRNLASVDLGNLNWWGRSTKDSGKSRFSTPTNVIVLPNCIGSVTGGTIATVLCPKYESIKPNSAYLLTEGIGIYDSSNVVDGQIMIYDSNVDTLSQTDFKNYIQGVELIYQITPTTETIQVSPFPISPTDTYTSANDTPYSAFEYKKNVEIWSCGEYSAVDGKYHILVQPLGGSIADIVLDEPLRKVNDVADTIEFADGSAVLTRKIGRTTLDSFSWTSFTSTKRWICDTPGIKQASTWIDTANILCTIYNTVSDKDTYEGITGIAMLAAERMVIYDSNYIDPSDITDFKAHIANVELIYEKSTPTTETIQVPQIAEAESYTCEISQGGKAVSWSSFETE